MKTFSLKLTRSIYLLLYFLTSFLPSAMNEVIFITKASTAQSWVYQQRLFPHEDH